MCLDAIKNFQALPLAKLHTQKHLQFNFKMSRQNKRYDVPTVIF